MTSLAPRSRSDAAAPPSPYLDDDGAWTSGEVARLFLVPAVVALLFVGGVYWVRQHMPAGVIGQKQNSVVQVQLLPRPDAVPIPVAAVSPQITQESMDRRTDTPSVDPDPTPTDDPPVVQQAKASMPTEAPPSRVAPAPDASSAAPSSAAIRFQQTLLRHVARYQRYPNAARPMQLQGKVDTQFAIDRDGTLLGVWVRTSSGQAMLDREALATIRRAQPFPRIPAELPHRLNIHVQLVFDPS